ncbi:hypothetical protein IFM89_013062 [Coptis chinensis]|uniref:SKP1-like protein n=1 Tax=Coptis chinensis TaxID=261450 RepID=A0A835HM31_9MAGN|nr:hypothetical protein IFM89_013062 [Coptis chinensis]
MDTSKKVVITLRSSDGEVFEVEEDVIIQSVTIKNLIEDGCTDGGIPIHNVTGDILAMVIEYCVNHAVKPDAKDEVIKLKKLDEELLKVDQATLFELVLAAHYLDIKNLMDLTSQAIADSVKHKSPDEISQIFNVKKYFTRLRKKKKGNRWTFY